MQILTAAMKIFLKKTKNNEAKAMLENVLDVATKEIDNADVRDRGFIYLRLLTKTPEVAKQVRGVCEFLFSSYTEFSSFSTML
jgi:vesicle coat complex subunit